MKLQYYLGSLSEAFMSGMQSLIGSSKVPRIRETSIGRRSSYSFEDQDRLLMSSLEAFMEEQGIPKVGATYSEPLMRLDYQVSDPPLLQEVLSLRTGSVGYSYLESGFLLWVGGPSYHQALSLDPELKPLDSGITPEPLRRPSDHRRLLSRLPSEWRGPAQSFLEILDEVSHQQAASESQIFSFSEPLWLRDYQGSSYYLIPYLALDLRGYPFRSRNLEPEVLHGRDG